VLKTDKIFLVFYILVIVSALVTPKLLWNNGNGSKCESDFPPPYPASNPSYTIETDGVKVYAWKHGQPFFESFDFGEVLEKAVNASSSEGGGLIYIRAGNYHVKLRHVITGSSSKITYYIGVLISKPRNVIIAGEGYMTILKSSSKVTNILYIYDALNFTLCNMIIDGNKQILDLSGRDGYSIILTGGGVNIVFKDLLLRNGKYCAIYVGNNNVLDEIDWVGYATNVTIVNVYTFQNDGIGVFLDATNNGKALNCKSENDHYAIGFSAVDWDWWNISQAFINTTIIDPVWGAFVGWYPEGKLQNITIYLSRPQHGYLFDFTNATHIEVENIYIYAKAKIERLIFINNGNVIFKGDFIIAEP